MTELMRPQAPYNHDAVRDIIEDITQSSAMRLDTVSMSKLWDLITMVLKWQLSVSEEVIKTTMRHLYELENYVTNPDTQVQLNKVQNLVDNFKKILSAQEKKDLRDDLLYWLKESNVRVSLLLKMGLQSMDGQFITTDLNPIADQMLNNIGENIYAVTDNGKILENKVKGTVPYQQPEVNELQLFVDQMLGSRKPSFGANGAESKVLCLTIDDPNGNDKNENEVGVNFDNIEVMGADQRITALMSDLGITDKNEESYLKDDLLNMIGGEDLDNE